MFHPQMTYRNVGRSGLKLSSYSLGGWTTFGGSLKDFTSIRSMLRLAYESGINFFDMADVYSLGEAERMMGAALKDFPRHELVLSSKVFWPMSEDVNDRGLSRKHIIESVNRSLARMDTEYLDIYYCHRYDPETPVEETVRIMDDLIHHGKILYWGTSEWTFDQISEALKICEEGGYYAPIVEQPQYSLLARKKFETDTLKAIKKWQLGTTVWSPLASGLLTGKYDEGIPPESRYSKMEWLRESFYSAENISRIRNMKEFSEQLNVSRTQLALAWVHSQESVSSVILGANSIEQLKENLGAIQIKIDDELQSRLSQLFAYD